MNTAFLPWVYIVLALLFIVLPITIALALPQHRRFIVPVVIFGALVVVLAKGLNLKPGCIPSPLIGKPVPAFTLTKIEDPTQQFSNKDFLGHKYLVNVWGTWCFACKEEHATLLNIARQNVVPIVGIDWVLGVDAKVEMSSAQRWLGQLGNPYAATGFDSDGRVAINFGVYGAPETFLVDEHGVVIYKYVGALTDKVWQTEFMPRINGTQQETTTCSS